MVRSTSRCLRAAIAATAIAAALAGCSSGKWGFPYIAPVQQGNWITSEQVALLRPGMTREQVRFALGSPTLTSVLHADRWDYPYYFKPGYGPSQERKFTVFFENDKLTRWEGDKQPDVQPFQLANDQATQAKAPGNGGAAPQNPAPASTGPVGPAGGGLPAGVTSSGNSPAAAGPSGNTPAQASPAGSAPAGTSRTAQPGTPAGAAQ
ncbi:outer membrane protein assembly factor BamE domain-containing protein [Bordetella genomosp. 11]|uniref:outer membrane protein assembly factor BamE domain-containing protein n=1 Tax=Bordetella genomosp. 11 TaxID=1416808 RepID=UPI0020CF9D17|nr:outer membrane protein assembly factor BamE [Bordetella genomosp. 11]